MSIASQSVPYIQGMVTIHGNKVQAASYTSSMQVMLQYLS